MTFENGATATLNMHAFAQETYRRTIVVGTKGEIVGKFDDGAKKTVTVNIFAPVDKFKPRVYNFSEDTSGHGGGDGGLIAGYLDYVYSGVQSTDITGIDSNVASH